MTCHCDFQQADSCKDVVQKERLSFDHLLVTPTDINYLYSEAVGEVEACREENESNCIEDQDRKKSFYKS